jgi:death-on-curing protein
MTDDEFSYPTPQDILVMHEEIVSNDPKSTEGVRKPDAPESALRYISEGYFGEVPETIHEKATHLMRLLVSDHPFVDGNKRTALNSTATFYAMNGYYFDYDDEIKDILKSFAGDEDVDVDQVINRCEELTRPVEEIDDEEIQAEVERLQNRVK